MKNAWSILAVTLLAVVSRAADSPVTWSAVLAKPESAANEDAVIVVTAQLAPRWIVYGADFKAELGPQPTQLQFEPAPGYRLLGNVITVAPKRKKDPAWDVEFSYFEERGEFRQKIRLLQPGSTIGIRIRGQLCNEHDGTCRLFEETISLRADRGAIVDAATLGARLFFDPILSRDRTVSCASCHKPEHAFADNVAFSRGVRGQPGTRNTPSAANTAGRLEFFWDGRASSLEEQALGPIANPREMDLPVADAVVRLNADPEYAPAFARVFRGPATAQTLAQAIAAFERTLETGNSPYDRYIAGDDAALGEAAKRGRLLFIGKANCASCHSGEDFTADRMKNIGLYNGRELADAGRGALSSDPAQLGVFKIPSLRNVAITAPYMHNGMFRTLREVVDYYNSPDSVVRGAINRDKALGTPLRLTTDEVADLVAFLESLTDDRFVSR